MEEKSRASLYSHEVLVRPQQQFSQIRSIRYYGKLQKSRKLLLSMRIVRMSPL